MAVYRYDGTELNGIFGLNGIALEQAYDINGEPLIEPTGYSINNVIEYYRTPTLAVAADVNDLSDDWQSFVFITDTHGSGNKQHSQAIGLYILSNTPAKMIVLGGDYSVDTWSKTEYDNYMNPFVDSDFIEDIYAVFGNHETYGGGTAEAKQSIYDDFLEDKTNITGVLADNYYYLDDTQNKIRYMFLNTSDSGSAYVMSNAQINWITDNVVLPTAEWSLVVIGHVSLYQMGGVTYSNESNGSDIISAIENCNGTIIGYICGHQHVDITEKHGTFQHTTLICDKFENINYYNGISVTDRVSGTESEQGVSVISINTTTKQVVIRRIGAGRNRTLSYTYEQAK